MTDATTPASEEWLELVDQVLLGLDHALNNRLGALRAFAELLRDEHWRTTNAATESVQKEVARLEETTRVVRLLARPRQPVETGLIVEEVMTDVVRLQAMLYDVRDTPIDFVPGPPLEPVWSERSELIRLLSVLVYALRRRSPDGRTGAALRVATESDDEWVRITFQASEPVGEDAMSDYAASLAASLGAGWGIVAGQLELRVPTLKAHRASTKTPSRRVAESPSRRA